MARKALQSDFEWFWEWVHILSRLNASMIRPYFALDNNVLNFFYVGLYTQISVFTGIKLLKVRQLPRGWWVLRGQIAD